MSNYITTERLYLRTEPVKGDNVITVMPLHTIVEAIGEDTSADWRKVKTVLGNELLSGFCASRYLADTNEPLPQITAVHTVPEVHLTAGKTVTRNGLDRAYPISEPAFARINLSSVVTLTDRVQSIYSVLDFLNVEKSLRYAPNSKSTYCNIYAYDVAYYLHKFLPRVWWYQSSLHTLATGGLVKPLYGKTVYELNANAIADWFEDFGASFKWKRIWDVDTLQREVNLGKLGVIVAQRINLNTAGHIVTVIPEYNANKANTNSAGKIIAPLQSQAGAVNRKVFSGTRWWDNPTKFGKFGFWLSEE